MLGFLLVVALIVVGAVRWDRLGVETYEAVDPSSVLVVDATTPSSDTPTPSPTRTPLKPLSTLNPGPISPAPFGTLIFGARRGGHSHLWATSPGEPRQLQLTLGDWDDRDPAVSPDGRRIAFASHRDGNWDLYLLDLGTAEVRRLTATEGFEGHPTWSPDGLWLAYEAYYDLDFDIWILPVDGNQTPIQLTSHPGADTSPSWDPQGRRIAFVSDRDESRDVFLADLDRPDERFTNLTHSSDLNESNPSFSPDGLLLAYTEGRRGLEQVVVRDMQNPAAPLTRLGQGRMGTWSLDGRALMAVLSTPDTRQVLTYALEGGVLPIAAALSGRIDGLVWTPVGLPGNLYPAHTLEGSEEDLHPHQVATSQAGGGRLNLEALPGVSAPNPSLSDATDEAFLALRRRVTDEVGWDFLGNLDYAFVGINDPMPPGFAYNDWLYTGRAFAFNQSTLQVGWVEIVKDEYAGQTYWRVFVRAGIQDGSLGEPLRERSWDFSARFVGDPLTYDLGGTEKAAVPSGFYVDFTELAADYGFERLPALPNWRTYYPGARFSEFAFTEGLDWLSAMLEIYPLSAIITPTPYRTPTLTPTYTPRPSPTPWWWRWRTPTPSPLPTATPTPTAFPTP